MQKRYELLELRPALSRRIDFEQACNELTVILRKAYGHAPKKLQILIFEDVLFAVNRLLELQTNFHLSCVVKLVQAAENVLPRQKKTQVVAKFKHAAVAHRRCNKILQHESECGEGDTDLAKDILLVIFSYLDAQSLAKAACVCRSWNAAALDELLWKNLYDVSFTSIYSYKTNLIHKGQDSQASANESIDWRARFKNTLKSYPTWFYASNRASCLICKRPVWFKSRAKGTPSCPICTGGSLVLKPLLSAQVSKFLLEDSISDSCSSSSESEDEEPGVKSIWATSKMYFDV
ncbi:hypothetical protein KP509_17G018500 [Ceratopteris richardii]|uniref:F-box domain-containing protein n=1 Tax=Ceratopteris richardii TaxID=49495 RepID=A0A8T2SWB6_CERRI|nr:hypothetical protein KP509_17G018500 [Ceratopteris richardii]